MNGSDSLRIDVALAERDVIKLILDFLEKRELFTSMVHLERETDIVNQILSEDLLYLRQLILNGQWNDVVDYVEPLKTIKGFNENHFRYVVMKYQYLELLCLKSEANVENHLLAQQITKFLNDFRKLIPTDQEYKKFAYLLTLKRLQDHPDYAQWSLYGNRNQCSVEILPLVQPFVQNEKTNVSIAENDRLIQLLVKGLLYESSVEHCQARATNTTEAFNLSNPENLLNGTRLSNIDVSLLSWLHALPNGSFSSPFEQKTLSVHIEKLKKLSIELPPPPTTSESVDFASPPMRSNVTSKSYVAERTLSTVEEESSSLGTSWSSMSKSMNQNGFAEEKEKSRAAILQHFDDEDEDEDEDNRPVDSFVPLVRVEDAQVIRAVDVHPSGDYFAVGSNSKILRVCVYPTTTDPLTSSIQPGKVLFQKGKHHQGSIYCLTWSPSGRLIGTGSNDKIVKILRLDLTQPDNPTNNTEIQLTHHDGTIRDLIFLQDDNGDEHRLISAGGGDRHICLNDIRKKLPIQYFEGHHGHVYSLYSWERNTFASASEDGTCRLWDIRQSNAIHSIPSRTSSSPVAAVAVNSSGQYLAAGYEDAFCLLYDLRTRRNLQYYQSHSDQVRSVRFFSRTNHLLTTSYDKQVIITSLSGKNHHEDLTKPLIHSKVAKHSDKIIQARWHPTKFSFVTSSADRSCVVWTSTSA